MSPRLMGAFYRQQQAGGCDTAPPRPTTGRKRLNPTTQGETPMTNLRSLVHRTTLAALLLAALAPAARAVTLSQSGGSVDITNGFSYPLEEASGLGLAKQQTELWSISDDNCIVFKMQLNGTAVSNYP